MSSRRSVRVRSLRRSCSQAKCVDDPRGAAEARAVVALATGDDRLGASLPEEAAGPVVVVAAVGDRRLRPASWAINAAAHGGARRSSSRSCVTSFRLPPVSVQASGAPPPARSRWCLLPRRPLSTGPGPVLAPPFCLQMARVGDSALPRELIAGVRLREQQRL
jgi:hypothetical protein